MGGNDIDAPLNPRHRAVVPATHLLRREPGPPGGDRAGQTEDQLITGLVLLTWQGRFKVQVLFFLLPLLGGDGMVVTGGFSSGKSPYAGSPDCCPLPHAGWRGGIMILVMDMNEDGQSAGWWDTPLGHGLGLQKVRFMPIRHYPGQGSHRAG